MLIITGIFFNLIETVFVTSHGHRTFGKNGKVVGLPEVSSQGRKEYFPLDTFKGTGAGQRRSQDPDPIPGVLLFQYASHKNLGQCL